MGYIYKIVNKTNGMTYVGQTVQILEERWRQHLTNTSNCRYLKSAFKKYGIEQFDFKMICVCFDEDLNKIEIQYMEKLQSIVPTGYNLREGGNSGRHNEETKKQISNTLKEAYKNNIYIASKPQLGKPHTEETKSKISLALKGRTDIIRPKPTCWIGKHHTEESKNKMSNSHKGKNTWNKGKCGLQNHSDETKQKISNNSRGNKSRTGQKQSQEEKNKKSESLKKYYAERREQGYKR